MLLNRLKPRKSLNKAFLRVKPNRAEIESFKTGLIQLLDKTNDTESEEYHKNLVSDFLKETYYAPKHFINTKGRKDLVIHNGDKAKSTVGVIIEAKKPTNKSEMVTIDKLNAKAFHELVLYYLRERVTQNNLEIKHLIVTNIYEWFIFNVEVFENAFAENSDFVKQLENFEAGRLASKKTDFFYKEIAAPFIDQLDGTIEFTHFDLRDYEELLQSNDKSKDNKLIALFKLLSPEHLLKLPFTNDSNSLDKGFYSELLHIIGLTETKKKSKKLIERNKPGERHSGTLLEDAIIQLDPLKKIHRVEHLERYGETKEDQLFNVALELSITWINRILFLKLLEAQLITYHKDDSSYSFLNLGKIKSYGDLNSLFFQVLAIKHNERNEDVKEDFAKVPYLNSSLFEPTHIDQDTLFISNLRNNKMIPILSQTVLKDQQGKKRTGELSTLEYLFEFLNAYDFSSEGSEDIQEENKTLINASVLGLIFEKINGYKEGSFFTPGFITMYMCRETIRKAVIQKFNETKNWKCKELDDLYDRIEDRKEANEIINSLKICNPAVGSGHFLVSALNEIIAIKNDLKILQDRNGRRLKEYHVEVVNDELVVTDEDGELFEYKVGSTEAQRIQETLFHEKQTIIENCLFGVDINANSVKICRLRLWIELLKNAYYKNATELETLPNIDINIKCGNSLISRFPIDADLRQALSKSKWNVETYRTAVDTYRNAQSKEEKHEMERLINDIKSDFRSEISKNHPTRKKLDKLGEELFRLTGRSRFGTGMMLFEPEAEYGNEKHQKKRKEKIAEIEKDIEKYTRQLAALKDNPVYNHAFEWRFEFPEVLSNDGDFMGFDVVIGNPPYINFKMYDSLTKSYLSGRYQKIYDGKSDIYYFFFYHGMEILKENGIFSNITSRYWIEAEFAEKLRNYISSSATLTEIVDFKNVTIFDGVGIKTAILSLVNSIPQEKATFPYMAIDSKKITEVELENYTNIEVTNESLIGKKSWILRNQIESKLLLKIKSKGHSLDSIAECKQGIVTGKDKAFVGTKGAFDYMPKHLVKEWVKVGDIQRFAIVPVEERELIYSNNIDELDKFPQLKKHLLNFKHELENRREVRKGVIRWFDLQWSRTNELFDSPKIICRFKAPKNTFAIDTEGTYSSADTTIVKLNEEWTHKIDLHYLVAVLNSKVLDYYFKSYGKLMDYRYEYYPGPVGLLPIVINAEISKISKLSKQISALKKSDPSSDMLDLENQINRLVYELYDLTEEEITIVEGSVK
ncbi:MAG: Eco57I restriction-modification methylase domain-containing protein [Ekhidna sp.]|nr:Eco57I restriction-modification methylase domain-containing protein [Ekhidna sp.]